MEEGTKKGRTFSIPNPFPVDITLENSLEIIPGQSFLALFSESFLRLIS